MMDTAKLKKHWLALLAILGIVFLLWLPQGLAYNVPIFEGWHVLYQYADAPLASIKSGFFPTRPLTYLPVLSGYLLTPGTSIGFNLTIALAILLRGVLAYGLLRLMLPQHYFLPLAVALLFMAYPSDRGLFIPRSLVPHYGVIFGLLAIYLLLRYWRKPQRWYWLAIPATQFASLGIHDLMYPLFFAAPFALWLMAEKPKPILTRRWLLLSVAWLALPSLLLLRVLWLLQAGKAGYLTDIMTLNARPVVDEQGYSFIFREGLRHLFERQILVWPEILSQAEASSGQVPLALFGLVLALLLIWLGSRPSQAALNAGKVALLSLGGLAIIILGFLPFIPGGYWAVDWRVFFASALGAALLIALFLEGLRRVAPFMAYALLAVLLGGVMLDGLGQQRRYTEASTIIHRLVGDVMIQTGVISPETYMILLDSSKIYNNDEIYVPHPNHIIRGALRYIYPNPPWLDIDKAEERKRLIEKIVYCRLESDALLNCQLEADHLIQIRHVTRDAEIVMETRYLNYEDLLIFNTRRDGSIYLLETIPPEFFAFDLAQTDLNAPIFSAYQPSERINPTAPPPARALTFFPCWPVSDCLPLVTPYDDTPQRAVNYEFDRVPSGTDWAQYHAGLENLWTTLPTATFYTRLMPDTDYRLSFWVLFYLLPETIANLTVSANGQILALSLEPQADGTLIYNAAIPAAILGEDGALDLRFYAAPLASPQALGMGADERELGLLFDWLRLEPAERD